eukprot:gene39928-53992_t
MTEDLKYGRTILPTNAIIVIVLSVVEFPRGSVLMNKLMVELWEVLKEHRRDLFDHLFEVRFVTTLSQQAVITLCYRQPMKEGRSRKVMKVAGGSETVVEELEIRGRRFKYLQTEGAFSQPNAIVCQKMIEWALDRSDDATQAGECGPDLLELYCGGGTFTAAMAQNFRKVLATEISKASVALAQENFKMNGIENVKIARLSSEEFNE